MHCFAPLTPTVFLERSAIAFPGSCAVRAAGIEVSYQTLRRRACKLASALQALGVEYGDRVALLSESSLEAVEAHFGIPGAGGVIVNINPWLPPAEVVAQIQFSGAKVLIASASFLRARGRPLLEQVALPVLEFAAPPGGLEGAATLDYEEELARASDEGALNGRVRSEMDPISINFTSGTTGKPKGVLVSHRGAYLHALGQVLMLSLVRESNYLWTLPMFHVSGWGHMWATVAVGARQILTELPEANPQDEARFARLVQDEKVSHLAGAPRLLRRIATMNEMASALRGRTIVTGGSAPTPQLISQLEEAGVRLIHQYGLNETCGPYVVCEEQDEWAAEDLHTRAVRRARQGVPAIHVGTGLRVVASDGRDVPADGKTAGEVLMSGNTVALGYYDNPEATERAFVDGWFRSGDLAVVHPDGYLEITDRIKDLIYVETEYGWENISSIEIENVLAQHPDVLDAAVIGARPPGSEAGARLVAFIETSGNWALTPEALAQFCSERLPAYKCPTCFIFEAIPKTATGKTQKALLVQRAQRRVMNESAYVQ